MCFILEHRIEEAKEASFCFLSASGSKKEKKRKKTAHEFDAAKSYSFWTGFLFVSIEQRERIAPKSKCVNDQILNDCLIGN
jgi:hypothetical protein